MASSQEFESLRARYLPEIEGALSRFLSDSTREIGPWCAQMTSYHLETGGKRLRALIPLRVFQSLGRDPAEAIPLGAAIEMIHNATLVHDDLQDGDEVRRNRPTVWKKYSSAQAINCGDAMFQYATRILARLEISPERLVRLIDRAAWTTLKVIEGQAQEFVLKDESAPTVEKYVEVIRGKTSGLFALPVVGAMEALGLEPSLCAIVEDAAMDLGMLFQIQDDYLDLYGNKGRDRVGTDLAEGKISFFVAYAREHGSPADWARLSAILKKPRHLTSAADIQEGLSIFERSGAKKAAQDKMRAIQTEIEKDAKLRSAPELREVLIELGELFLEPIHENL